jgi:hypothetical protein
MLLEYGDFFWFLDGYELCTFNLLIIFQILLFRIFHYLVHHLTIDSVFSFVGYYTLVVVIWLWHAFYHFINQWWLLNKLFIIPDLNLVHWENGLLNLPKSVTNFFVYFVFEDWGVWRWPIRITIFFFPVNFVKFALDKRFPFLIFQKDFFDYCILRGCLWAAPELDIFCDSGLESESGELLILIQIIQIFNSKMDFSFFAFFLFFSMGSFSGLRFLSFTFNAVSILLFQKTLEQIWN